MVHYKCISLLLFSRSAVSDSASPSTTARLASLSFIISWSLHKLMSTELEMSSNHSSSFVPLSSCLQSFPASESFPVSQLFALGGQSVAASASASILPMNIEGWFPLGLTNLISLLSKGLSRVFSSTTVLRHQFLGTYCLALTSVHDYWKNHSFDHMDLCWQNNISAF